MNVNTYTLNIPFKIKVSNKKSIALNLNIYRNLHYQINNKCKQEFNIYIKEQVKLLPTFNTFNIRYKVFPKTKRLFDTNNICCIVDKFLCDSLVFYNKIKDDNYLYLKETIFSFGEISKDNPRIEAIIEILS